MVPKLIQLITNKMLCIAVHVYTPYSKSSCSAMVHSRPHLWRDQESADSAAPVKLCTPIHLFLPHGGHWQLDWTGMIENENKHLLNCQIEEGHVGLDITFVYMCHIMSHLSIWKKQTGKTWQSRIAPRLP